MTEVVIRFSLGDAHYLAECLFYAVRYRQLRVIRSGLWVMREHYRRGTWKPWTLGDYVNRHRRRAWMQARLAGAEAPPPAPWRHSAVRRGSYGCR